MGEIQLSDEQITQLNSHEPVQLARTQFLKKATEYVKHPSPEAWEERVSAETEFVAAFNERLEEVKHWQPQPVTQAVTTRRMGFKQ